MDSSPSFSPLVVGFDFFTEGEKPAPSVTGRDEPSVEGSTIRLASQDPLFDSVKERRLLLPFAYGDWEQKIPSSKNRRFVLLRKTLLLTSSKRDQPIVEGSTIRLASRDPSLRLFTIGFFTEGEKPVAYGERIETILLLFQRRDEPLLL